MIRSTVAPTLSKGIRRSGIVAGDPETLKEDSEFEFELEEERGEITSGREAWDPDTDEILEESIIISNQREIECSAAPCLVDSISTDGGESLIELFGFLPRLESPTT